MSETLNNKQVNDGSHPVGTVIKSATGADTEAVALVRIEGGWLFIRANGRSTQCPSLVGVKYEVLHRPAEPLRVGEAVDAKAEIERRAEGRRVVVSDESGDIVRWDGFNWSSIDGSPHIAPFRVLHVTDADVA